MLRDFNATKTEIDRLNNTLLDKDLTIQEKENEITMLLEQIERLKAVNVSTSNPTPNEVLAFPTATGAGAYATGGRGYPVYKVTSLSDSGSGTFRQALLDCESNGGGNIVFEVSGTILLSSLLYIENLENVTVAGQTSPVGGITVAGTGSSDPSWALAPKMLINSMSNCIWRYIRFRPDLVSSNHDVVIFNNSQNYIVDHCSFAFGTDEGADSTNLNDNFTIQYCNYNACKTGQIVGSSDDISHASNVSFNNNLFYNTSHRFANASVSGRYDNINNLIWNFNARMMVLQGDGLEMNHINNYYASIYGDINTVDPTYSFGRRGIQYWWNDGSQGTVTTAPSFYTSGNDVINTSAYSDFDMYVWRFAPPVSSGYTASAEDPLPAGFESNTQFPLIGKGFDIKTSAQVKSQLPYQAGANAVIASNGTVITDIDSVDNVSITNIAANNQVYYNQVFDRTQLEQIGYAEDFWNTFSLTPINTRNDDSNGDGVPDVWASANIPSGKVASDIADNGYTYFENYINSVDN